MRRTGRGWRRWRVIPSWGVWSIGLLSGFLEEPHSFSTSLALVKQWGSCFASQMISPCRRGYLLNVSTSQPDHTFAPTLSNNIKNYVLWQRGRRDGEESQRKIIACSKPSFVIMRGWLLYPGLYSLRRDCFGFCIPLLQSNWLHEPVPSWSDLPHFPLPWIVGPLYKWSTKMKIWTPGF